MEEEKLKKNLLGSLNLLCVKKIILYGGNMRIITGIAKGRKLNTPDGMDTRPTADRVKESLFNIIASKIRGARVLDLYAGTGNLGLEAISQGASSCIFVEHNRTTYNILNENIMMLGFQDKTEKNNGDAIATLGVLHRKDKKFEVILLDPPYGMGLITTSLVNIDKYELLGIDGIIVGEYDINDVVPEKIGKLALYRTEKYGRTKISFWHMEEENE